METLTISWCSVPMHLDTLPTTATTTATGVSASAHGLPLVTGTARALTLTATIGTGLVAGVFFAFSTFVMPGLRRAPEQAGLQAMQGINAAAPNPLFMLVLLGTAGVCVALGGRSLLHLDEPGATLRLAGSAVYLAGILLTIAWHVPHNDALATVDPSSAEGVRAWNRYYGPWTLLNHVRTLTSIGGFALLLTALVSD